jgi:hypothetical protein
MTYLERKNRYDPKAPVPEDVARKVAEQRRDLWRALNTYIFQQGGSVTTLPDKWPMRIEVGKDSALPVKLGEFGYTPRHVGATMRTTGQGITQVDVLEINLPQPTY